MPDLTDPDRGLIDYLGIACCALALVALAGLGIYGVARSFIQSQSYLKANEWVALGMGVLGAGCGLYLATELAGRLRGRQVVAICMFAGLVSVFAVTKGFPAAVTNAVGHRVSVAFVVTGHGGGGRSCSRTVLATNPGFEEFSLCERYLPRPASEGDVIDIKGIGSGWGLVRTGYSVR